ncbi:MAG: hypothetical protein ACK5OC_14000 [Pirellula sp.]|jgi:hypothetical protein
MMDVLSRNSKLVAGSIAVTVPTIIYGGLALLGLLTGGVAGSPADGLELDDRQLALWRAGHAHAGVLVIFSILAQPFLDHVRLTGQLTWFTRIGFPVSAICISAGFFGLAFYDTFRFLLYAGALLLAASVMLFGVGLIRSAFTVAHSHTNS